MTVRGFTLNTQRGYLNLSTLLRYLTDQKKTSIIGNESVRELQRLLTEMGYSVGSIDGLIGANTLKALELVEDRYLVKLDARNNLETSIDNLRKVIHKK